MNSALKKAMRQNSNSSNKSNSHVLIRHVSVGDSFSGVYFVQDAFERVARNGNIYSDWTLRDRSGESFVRHWGPTNGMKRNNWIEIIATVEEYRGKLQIIAQEIKEADVPSEAQMNENYLIQSESKEQDSEAFALYRDRVDKICDEIDDQTCRLILDSVFSDAVEAHFKKAPASDKPFYGMDGGLLKHTIKTAYAVAGFSKQYGFSSKESCLAVTAALLHRVGALDAFRIEGCQPAMTVFGKLYGIVELSLRHVIKAAELVQSKEGFKSETAQRVIHAIKAQEGQAILPMTKEAILLSEAVNMDIKLVNAIEFIDNDLNSDDEFTAFDPISKRQFFKGSDA